MSTSRLVLIGGFGVIALLILIIWIVGQRLPASHNVSVSRDFSAPPEQLAALIRNVEQHPNWRTGVRAIAIAWS